MRLFVAEFLDNTAILSPSESHHLTKVLRMREGETIFITDGKGKLAKGIVSLANTKKCEVEITEYIPYDQKRDYHLHMALCPTKSNDRNEWFLEKATELGIDEVSWLNSFHSERKKINLERFEKITLSAVKQSLKAEIPTLHPLISFQEFIQKYQNFTGIKCIAHCNHTIPRKSFKEVLEPHQPTLVAIGPEGDFTEEEIQMAIDAGFISISLGNQRLRTETAALSCVQALHWLHS